MASKKAVRKTLASGYIFSHIIANSGYGKAASFRSFFLLLLLIFCYLSAYSITSIREPLRSDSRT